MKRKRKDVERFARCSEKLEGLMLDKIE